ncbi:MAG: YceI family protein [Phycisphaerae bacterium]|nr:YceI family protein [Phycisphaerae bacterium]
MNWKRGAYVTLAALATSAAIGLGSAVVGGAVIGDNAAAQAGTAAGAKAASFAIDLSHSSIVYKTTHMGVSNHWGRFNDFSGTYSFDPKNPAGASFDVTIKAESIDSGDKKRDGHLRTPDFFNAKEQATITFKGAGATAGSAGAFELKGDLTLLGKTKPITAKLVHIGEKDLGKMGYRSGVEATFTIKRSDFGMNYMVENGGIGDEVHITVSLEGVRQ